jgi:hypothetical protein
MIKIGFIDYFLDEWHANNYPAWIRASSKGSDYSVSYAWAAMDKPGGLTTRDWCSKFGVQMMPTQEALIEASDCLVLLSPDHPEQHEALAQQVLRSGKPTYIDKTFAPDYATALRLFALAEKSGTPLYSTSALRYAAELNWLKDQNKTQNEVAFVSARGPGVFANYAIHQLEMIVKVMGPGAVRALAAGTPEAPVIVYSYDDGRSCLINHLPWSGFSLAIQTKDQKGVAFDIKSDFWKLFIEDLLLFFETGKPPVDQAETCAAMAMIEAGRQALARPGEWVAVPGKAST